MEKKDIECNAIMKLLEVLQSSSLDSEIPVGGLIDIFFYSHGLLTVWSLAVVPLGLLCRVHLHRYIHKVWRAFCRLSPVGHF